VIATIATIAIIAIIAIIETIATLCVTRRNPTLVGCRIELLACLRIQAAK
jgi:hypothetical protein